MMIFIRTFISRNRGHLASAWWLRRLLLIAIAVMLAATASCDRSGKLGISDQATPATSKNDGNGGKFQQVSTNASSLDPESSQFVEQGLEQLNSPFTKETVLALNAIVSRSLSAIEEFDEARRRLETESDENVAGKQKLYTGLSKKAELARVDMNSASQKLRNSGERYNQAIFAAMVRFVDNVDQEIREEIEGLRKDKH